MLKLPFNDRGRRDRMQSVPITTKVVSSNPVHCEVYSIQHYVINLSATGRWFSQGTPVFSTNKTDRYDITEILLKVALNTINQLTFQLLLSDIPIESRKLIGLQSKTFVNIQSFV